MRNANSRFFAALIAASVLIAIGGASAGGAVPVMVGGAPELDACGGLGVVQGLDRDGDGFLAVRAGPGTGYAEIDRLHNGDQVLFCDQNGNWIGVVYGRPGIDCAVGSPMPKRQAYQGPCKSGWAYRKWLALIAG